MAKLPQKNKKRTVVKRYAKEIDPEVVNMIELVYTVRSKQTTNPPAANLAYEKLIACLDGKIKKIVGKFKIPGFSFDDIYQEALYALLYKAIKDYDETRGSIAGSPAHFDRFALLCIRRHLATTLKTSHQNRKRILNSCKSLDQDRSTGTDEDLSLINILPTTDGDILDLVKDKEYFGTLIKKLFKKLSALERKVLYLYAKQYSYEEIARIINEKLPKKEYVDSKTIDNALSRLKAKSRVIMQKYEKN